MMFSAKLANACNNKFSAFRTRNDKGFHAVSIKPRGGLMPCFAGTDFIAGFLAYGVPKFGSTAFFYRLRAVVFAFHGRDKAWFLTKMGNFQPFDGFGSSLVAEAIARFTASRGAHVCATSRGDFQTQGRTRDASEIEATFTEGLERIEPILFSCGQEFRKQYQFENIKDKGVFAVLIPGCLQFRVAVNALIEAVSMVFPALPQVDGAAYVELAGNSTGDTVDARSNRKSGHLSKLLMFSTLCCLLSGSQGRSRSAWIATPSLDNTAIIPSFGRGEKWL